LGGHEEPGEKKKKRQKTPLKNDGRKKDKNREREKKGKREREERGRSVEPRKKIATKEKGGPKGKKGGGGGARLRREEPSSFRGPFPW